MIIGLDAIMGGKSMVKDRPVCKGLDGHQSCIHFCHSAAATRTPTTPDGHTTKTSFLLLLVLQVCRPTSSADRNSRRIVQRHMQRRTREPSFSGMSHGWRVTQGFLLQANQIATKVRLDQAASIESSGTRNALRSPV